MKLKKNRTISYLIILAVYAVATAVGIFSYKALESMSNLFLQVLAADAIATVVVFVFSLVLNNASVYDPYWSIQPIVICFAFAFKHEKWSLSTIILLAIIGVWGVRLTLNWAYTFKNLNHQDWRYTMLKEKTGALYPLVNLFGIHLFPTFVVWAVILPAIYTIFINAEFNVYSIPFLVLSVFAIILQSVSDAQMHAYRKNRDGNFIRRGLWKYSRHPNYLGEILMWWGVGLSVVISDFSAWHLLFGALINTLMFVFISMPMADKRQSKKDGFDEYKKQTRALFPIKKFMRG